MAENSSGPSYDDKFQRFSSMVSTKTMQGFMVADRNDKALVAVLVKPAEKVNHLLHLAITACTCGGWGLVWLVLSLIAAKEKRVRISIDGSGTATEEQLIT